NREWEIVGMGNDPRPAAPPLGIGNREWGIVGMGNDGAGGGGGEKTAVGCGVGRSSSPIPHSRFPIPGGGGGSDGVVVASARRLRHRFHHRPLDVPALRNRQNLRMIQRLSRYGTQRDAPAAVGRGSGEHLEETRQREVEAAT